MCVCECVCVCVCVLESGSIYVVSLGLARTWRRRSEHSHSTYNIKHRSLYSTIHMTIYTIDRSIQNAHVSHVVCEIDGDLSAGEGMNERSLFRLRIQHCNQSLLCQLEREREIRDYKLTQSLA